MTAVVDKEKCIGCGACVDTCPTQAIEMQDEKAIISDECVDCGACVGACPVEAISL
jgi:NAD-dependent dihydropyrimidine dehydrogenase PreA subunit